MKSSHRIVPTPLEGFSSWSGLPLVTYGQGTFWAAGRGRTLNSRLNSSQGESVERATIANRTSGRLAPRKALRGAVIEPYELGLDLDWERPFGVVPFDKNTNVRWEEYISIHDQKIAWVHEPLEKELAFYRLTSNGAAVGRSAEHAVRSAINELIERDAFMAWWYGLSGAVNIDVSVAQLSKGYDLLEDVQWEYDAIRLNSRPGYCVVMVCVFIETRSSPSGVVVGCAAEPEEKGIVLPTLRAFDECVQAVDIMRLNQSVTGSAPPGVLGKYYCSPARAIRIGDHLKKSRLNNTINILAQTADIFFRLSRSADTDYWFARAVSPHTIPFNLSPKGARRQHFMLRNMKLRSPSKLPVEEHPLG